jgi:hypothetical protein
MSATTMTLGDLIDALTNCDAKYVRIASPVRLTPASLSSYRGYYEDLAIEYEEGDRARTAIGRADFLRMLKEAVGATFTGYKGGEFMMGRDTLLWVSNYGECSSCRVVGVEVDDDTAYLTLTVRWRKP